MISRTWPSVSHPWCAAGSCGTALGGASARGGGLAVAVLVVDRRACRGWPGDAEMPELRDQHGEYHGGSDQSDEEQQHMTGA